MASVSVHKGRGDHIGTDKSLVIIGSEQGKKTEKKKEKNYTAKSFGRQKPSEADVVAFLKEGNACYTRHGESNLPPRCASKERARDVQEVVGDANLRRMPVEKTIMELII